MKKLLIAFWLMSATMMVSTLSLATEPPVDNPCPCGTDEDGECLPCE